MGILRTFALTAIAFVGTFVVGFAIMNGGRAPATRSAFAVPSAPRQVTEGGPSSMPGMQSAPSRQARYYSCVSDVEADYDSSWANACFDKGEGRGCELPVIIASALNAAVEQGRNRCLQEVNAGLR